MTRLILLALLLLPLAGEAGEITSGIPFNGTQREPIPREPYTKQMQQRDCLATMEAAIKAAKPFVHNWNVNEHAEAFFKFNSTFMADYHKAARLIADAEKCMGNP